MFTRRYLLLAVAGVVVAAGAWLWFSPPPGVEVVSLDPPPTTAPATPPSSTTSSAPPAPTSPPTSTPTSTTSPVVTTPPPSTTAPSSDVEVVLLAGTDSRAGLDTGRYGNFSGARTDSLILVFVSPSAPTRLVSLPRDLVVTDVCRRSQTRINAVFSDCGDWSGPARLAATVSAATGVTVDHLVSVDMAGFIAVVDRLGGYEVFTEFPLRDQGALLNLPAGATTLDGAGALAWVRSRKTEVFRDGRWRSAAASDLTRAAAQRRLVTDLAGRLRSAGPATWLGVYSDIAPFLSVSSELTVSRLLALASATSDPSAWVSTAVPVRPGRLGEASVVYPARDLPAFFADLLAE